jgi:NAD(P)-dependent dehydrogenase (short-subunit alcohol dehydrogenase family)
MVSVLVTGTNQGIGLGLVRQLAKRSYVDHIFATVRDPESSGVADLKTLASENPSIHIIKLELNEASINVNSSFIKGLIVERGRRGETHPRVEGIGYLA